MQTIEWNITKEPIDYNDALQFMEKRVQNIHQGTENELIWMLEHPPLYTAGTSAKENDLLSPDRFPVYQAGRGGEYTYHGPGQRVAYIMLNLNQRQSKDVRQYICNLEEAIIRTLRHFDIKGERRKERIGIWVDDGSGHEAKIAAIGVRLRKWVTFHGISINVAPDLSHFNGIVPCGIKQYGVTSMQELGIDITMDELDTQLKKELIILFG